MTPKYRALIDHMRDGIVAATAQTGNPMEALMLMSDVSAAVLIKVFPRDQWDASAQVFCNRLDNTIDREIAMQGKPS